MGSARAIGQHAPLPPGACCLPIFVRDHDPTGAARQHRRSKLSRSVIPYLRGCHESVPRQNVGTIVGTNAKTPKSLAVNSLRYISYTYYKDYPKLCLLPVFRGEGAEEVDIGGDLYTEIASISNVGTNDLGRNAGRMPSPRALNQTFLRTRDLHVIV
jgi:hypothetical protein